MELAYLLVAMAAFAAAAARTLRVRGAAAGWIAMVAVVFFAIHTGVEAFGWDGNTYRDFLCFWKAGLLVRAGKEAYSEAIAQNCPFYNPPTALPLFAALATFSAARAYALWTALNGAMILAMIPACRKALARDGSASVEGLDPVTVVALTAALGLSNATRSNLINGQMGILVGFALVLAYWARNAGAAFASAAAWTAATIKINLMLPLGLLLLRRRDRRIVIWLAALVLAICLGTARPSQQWARARTLATGIARSTDAGQMNDYSRAGPHPADMLGFDKLFYHLGVADRATIRVLQGGALLLLGMLLAVLAWKGNPAPGLLASLLALYAVIFLYHRNYDAIILGLPLAFAAGHARTAKTAARWWMSAAVLAMLTALYLPRKALFLLMQHHFERPAAGTLVEYFVLPAATWLVLASMLCLWKGAATLHPKARSDYS